MAHVPDEQQRALQALDPVCGGRSQNGISTGLATELHNVALQVGSGLWAISLTAIFR